VCVCVCVYVYMCVYLCVRAFICVSVCTWLSRRGWSMWEVQERAGSSERV